MSLHKYFLNDINHGYKAAMLKKNCLWLLPSFMAVATCCYYEKVRRMLRTAIVLDLLKFGIFLTKKISLPVNLLTKAEYALWGPDFAIFENNSSSSTHSSTSNLGYDFL